MDRRDFLSRVGLGSLAGHSLVVAAATGRPSATYMPGCATRPRSWWPMKRCSGAQQWNIRH